MPISIRKDGKTKQIADAILGPPIGGVVDSFGKKKRFIKKKRKIENGEGEAINRYEEIGLQ